MYDACMVARTVNAPTDQMRASCGSPAAANAPTYVTGLACTTARNAVMVNGCTGATASVKKANRSPSYSSGFVSSLYVLLYNICRYTVGRPCLYAATKSGAAYSLVASTSAAASAAERSALSNSTQPGVSTPKSMTSVPAPSTRMAHAMLPTAELALANAKALPPAATPTETAGSE